jgi:NAD+ diphosphatase
MRLVNPVDLIIVNKNSQILLARRSKPGWDSLDTWCIPGGGVDSGESFEEGIKREIKEELGCNIVWMKYFKSYYLKLKDTESRTVYFYGEIDKDPKLKRDELSEYKWFNWSDPTLLNLDFAFNQKTVIKEFIEFYKKES